MVTCLAMAGCSKDEMEEAANEGISAVATPAGGSFVKRDGLVPSVWFNLNSTRMHVQLAERPNQIAASTLDAKVSWNEEVIRVVLSRAGNSSNFHSAPNSFNFSDDQYFSMLALTLNWNAADGTPQEYSDQLFLYPSGRTVAQDPKVMRMRERDNCLKAIVVADDPAQEVAFLEYRKGYERLQLEKTHFNQALGLSSWSVPAENVWVCEDVCPADENGLICGETVHLRTNERYNSGFFAPGDPNASVISKSYAIVRTGDSGPVAFEESDEPVILGSRLTNSGDIYKLTLALLSPALEDARITFLPTDGPAPMADTYMLTPVSVSDGNLYIYEVRDLRFNGPLTDFTEFRVQVTGKRGVVPCRVRGTTTYCPTVRECSSF